MVAAQIGFIQNIGGAEVLLIAIVALVVLGPERLPELGRSAGRMVHKLKTMTDGLQSEVRDVMDDPSMQPIKELSEFAARPRQKLTQYALEAEAEERGSPGVRARRGGCRSVRGRRRERRAGCERRRESRLRPGTT